MKFWMSCPRELDGFIDGHRELLPAWRDAGVDAVVVGPMEFGSPLLPAHRGWPGPLGGPARAAFDPDPATYRAFNVPAPDRPEGDDRRLRAELEAAMAAVKEAGMQLHILSPLTGTGPRGSGHRFAAQQSRRAIVARTVDTLQAFPMVDGLIVDGPSWGFEFEAIPDFGALGKQRNIFGEAGRELAEPCAELGFDYAQIRKACSRLDERLHSLDDRLVQDVIDVGPEAAWELLAGPGMAEWFAFRQAVLTRLYQETREAVDAARDVPVVLGLGPRSAAFAPLAGFDGDELAGVADVLLPKLYLWHRGYDGLVGTVARLAETLVAWNDDLTLSAAMRVVRCLFDLEAFPEVDESFGFEHVLDDATIRALTKDQIGRVVEVARGRVEVVPWVGGGRSSHDGDPMTSGQLHAQLEALQCLGIDHFSFFMHSSLTPGDWTVLSQMCGQVWHPRHSDYRPPDQAVL